MPREDHTPLTELSGRPYAVELGAGPPPERVLAALSAQRPAADHIAALWGDWFGGGVVLLHAPLEVHPLADALDAAGLLTQQPGLRPDDRPTALLGGGWLACLGFSPDTSWVGFYDACLRWRDGSWTFESLGLDGRRAETDRQLAHWRWLLAAASSGPGAEPGTSWQVGPFSTEGTPVAARRRHLAAVEHAVGRIHRGDFYQVNLCTRLYAPVEGDPVSLFADLSASLQPRWGALVSPGAAAERRTVASFSPELFLRVQDRRVTTSPIKGTAPRRPEDRGAPLLRASAKDAAENIMIVDLMRNDLSRVAEPGSVTVEDLLGLEPHPGVWHLVSTVGADLRPEVDLADLLQATFPPGSVTGAPKQAAVRAIAALEAQPRGVYTGSIGFSSALAGTELNVAIRTFEIAGSALELGVGGGITVDSVAVREWYECLDKAAPLVRAARSTFTDSLSPKPAEVAPHLAAGGVFETVLALGSRVLRLATHLARLDRSCRELYGVGVPTDLAARVRATVDQANLGETGAGVRRAVRVLARPLDDGVAFTVTVRPLGARLTSSALVRGHRGSGSWRHKWADRTELAAAETAASEPAGMELGGEVAMPYFVDASGDVTECSRGNLFRLGRDGVWQTPPAEEDLLPGVTRREVLDLLADQGRPVRLKPFPPADLGTAAAAFWTSSLSGAVVVTAVDGRPIDRDDQTVAALNAALGLERAELRPADRRR